MVLLAGSFIWLDDSIRVNVPFTILQKIQAAEDMLDLVSEICASERVAEIGWMTVDLCVERSRG